jgi:hypothetical protein
VLPQLIGILRAPAGEQQIRTDEGKNSNWHNDEQRTRQKTRVKFVAMSDKSVMNKVHKNKTRQ